MLRPGRWACLLLSTLLSAAGCTLGNRPTESCTVTRDEDAGTATIRCPDGTSTVLRDGVPGTNGASGERGPSGADGRTGPAGSNGTSCSVAQDDGGLVVITCPDGTRATVQSGSSCTAVRDVDAGVTHIRCTDGTSATVVDGKDGMSCTAVDNGNGSKTLRCPDGTVVTVSDGQDGAQGPSGQPGQDGTSCTVSHDGGVSWVQCEDGTVAVLPGASAAASDGGATVAVEPPGPNCLHGGVAITAGTTTQYVCNASPASVLSVVTAAASSVSYRDAELGGTATLMGSDVVLGKGICYAASPGVTLSSTCVTVSGGSGAFGLSVTGLLPGTAYFVRAFATSASGTALGNEVSFQTLPLAVPAVSTDSPLNVSRYSVRLGGNVSDDGGSAVLARGLCWNTAPAPTLADSKVLAGADVGAFSADAIGLTPGTTYYARAFATNSQGTAYGQEVSFTTTALPLALLTTSAPTAVSYRTASASGSITSDEGSPVTARGVCYATHSHPTRTDSSIFAGAGIGTISASLTGLLPSTTYYLRAWAENAGGTAYGDVQAFTTLSLTTPTLSTTAAGGISNTTANSGGNISDDGGTSVTARGVCYSTAPLPTLAGNCTADGTGAGAFSSLIGGLAPNTTYYARAFATNSNGTAFGNQVSFVTSNATQLVGVPVVGTGSVSVLSGSSATGGGYISQDGGTPVTARGVCWSLSMNPTLSDTCTSSGSGTGNFTALLTGLTGCGTTIYVRAYASNANGTGFGNTVTFVSGGLPVVTTDPITNITTATADASGTITDDGGCDITKRGFVWSASPDPTLSATTTLKTEALANGNSLSATLTGLLPNMTLYARAYASNAKGTNYGPSRMFTTLTPGTLFIGQSFGGGIVFHIDETGQHGLIVHPSNLPCQLAPVCTGADAVTSTEMGSGSQNTANVLATCGSATPELACDQLGSGGYSDWYLPSQAELILIRDRLDPYQLASLSAPIQILCNGTPRTEFPPFRFYSSTWRAAAIGPAAGQILPVPVWGTCVPDLGMDCYEGYQFTFSSSSPGTRCVRSF